MTYLEFILFCLGGYENSYWVLSYIHTFIFNLLLLKLFWHFVNVEVIRERMQEINWGMYCERYHNNIKKKNYNSIHNLMLLRNRIIAKCVLSLWRGCAFCGLEDKQFMPIDLFSKQPTKDIECNNFEYILCDKIYTDEMHPGSRVI